MPSAPTAPPAEPSPAARAEAAARAEDERSERIRFSAPLLLLGAASLACSYVLYTDAFSNHATRIPIWVLALSVGLIASVGGTASMLVGDYSGVDWAAEAAAADHLVVVRRDEWEAIQAELTESRAGSRPTLWASGAEGGDLELPAWEEPVSSKTGEEATPLPVQGPPAPLAVTHQMDSLATEVDRLVADLETSVAEVGVRTPGMPRAPAPSPATSAASTPVPPASIPTPTKSAGTPPKTSTARPTPPSVPTEHRAPTPRGEPPPVVAGEFRALMEELEKRAGAAIDGGALQRPKAPAPGAAARCVGCDAKLAAGVVGAEVCRSCKSRMCADCAKRSATEGHRGLCPVCSILEEPGDD
jgi:hypothetical protein